MSRNPFSSVPPATAPAAALAPAEAVAAASPAPPVTATAGATATERLWQIDALRGLMLVLMTLTHLPTRLSSPAGQPFGFVSAAEGFVLLSGFMAGMVYARRQRKDGETVMRAAFLQRVVKIYLCQAALLGFVFSFIALFGIVWDEAAINNLLAFYRQNPPAAVVGGLLLIYKPPLLDILPMYILFMLASPVLLVHGLQQGWRAILVVSAGLWLGSQFGLGHHLYETFAARTGLPIPVEAIGAFKVLSWQFVWVLGLWLGASRVTDPTVLPERFPRWFVATAIGIALVGFGWRHTVGQVPFPGRDDLNLLLDKWQIGPLRLLNLFALLTLSIHFAPWAARRLPRLRFLETLGSASLPVFCAHLVFALLALAVAGDRVTERPWSVDLAILGASFAGLAAVALVSQWLDRRAAAVTRRVKDALAASRRPAGAPRSPASTPHSPPR